MRKLEKRSLGRRLLVPLTFQSILIWSLYFGEAEPGNSCHRMEPVYGSQYSFFFPTRSISDYVNSRGAPEMTERTVCFWVNTSQTFGGDVNLAHYISYASDGEDNELIVGSNDEIIFLTIKDDRKWHTISSSKITDGRWHSVCSTWSSQNGVYTIYIDGEQCVQGHVMKDNIIRGGGIWVLGQDQDTLGGGFDANQMLIGEISNVNIWNVSLTDEEIKMFSAHCQSELKGNVKSWDDFKSGVKGGVIIQEESSCNKA